MTTLIFDLNDVLLPLEYEVIKSLLDIETFVTSRQTVEYHKTCWVRSRLFKLKCVPVAPDSRFLMCNEQAGKIENLARHLESEFYRSVQICQKHTWVYQHEWVVELLYNSLYLKTINK